MIPVSRPIEMRPGMKRHKGLSLIDRSIPVAYQEGEDLNTDKCILLRRMVE